MFQALSYVHRYPSESSNLSILSSRDLGAIGIGESSPAKGPFGPVLLASSASPVHWCEMARLYVGNLDPRTTARELEDEFRVFGVLRSVWVARKPPGFAFIDFDDRRDAQDAIRDLDGKNGWRVELSRNSSSRGRDRHGASDMKCYECGETGHFARECRLRIGPGGLGSGRRRSRTRSRSKSPRYRRSPSYGRRSSSPRDRSPRRRSPSSPRRSSYSKSPPYENRHSESPQANGYQRRSRS